MAFDISAVFSIVSTWREKSFYIGRMGVKKAGLGKSDSGTGIIGCACWCFIVSGVSGMELSF